MGTTAAGNSVEFLIQIANVVDASRSHALALELPLVNEGRLHDLPRGKSKVSAA